jgi:ParB-like chromosome segregation protein Spo0J
MSFEIRIMPVDQLKPAPYNPRRILKPGDRAYRKLKQSLENFGLVEPLIWNETTGHLIGGHARLRILRELQIETIPVSVVRLTSAREKALNLVLNNREAQGRDDPEKLETVLTELEALPEFEMTGFELSDLKSLRFEPETDLAEDELQSIRIILECDQTQFAELESQLNPIVEALRIRCHVQQS